MYDYNPKSSDVIGSWHYINYGSPYDLSKFKKYIYNTAS